MRLLTNYFVRLMAHNEDVFFNLEQQLGEFELLQSMYCSPGEFIVDSPDTLVLMRACINDAGSSLPKGDLNFSINLEISVALEHFSSSEEDEELAGSSNLQSYKPLIVYFEIPQIYPLLSNPKVRVRSNELSRRNEEILNKKLEDHINSDLSHAY